MRKLTLSIAGVIAALAVVLPAAAQSSLDRFLDSATRQALAEKGILIRVFQDKDALKLVPATSSSAELSSEAADFAPTLGVEVLRLFPDTPRRLDTPQEKLALLNTLASVSSLKGITYWSTTRNKVWTLFTDSYAVESPQHPVRTPDPVFMELPSQSTIYSYQEDSTFGKNVYRTTFRSGPSHLWTTTMNVNPISMLIFPVIPEGGLVNHALIVPTDTALIYYGLALLRSSFPGMNGRVYADSLTNRVIALSDWLKGKLGP